MYLIHKCGRRVQFTHYTHVPGGMIPNHDCSACGTIEGPSLDLIWVTGKGSHVWARVKAFFRKLVYG